MPHVIVKLAAGKSEQQKIRLVEAIVKDVINAFLVQVRSQVELENEENDRQKRVTCGTWRIGLIRPWSWDGSPGPAYTQLTQP
jgi:hypothetical protein